MNSQELFVNLCQIISTEETGMTWPTDYDREAVVHVSRSARRGADQQISHITIEFAGVRAKFFCCILFDGSGPYGASFREFAMPRIRTTINQKAMGFLSVIEYLVSNGYLGCDSNFEFFREKVIADLNGGVGDTLIKYDQIKARTRRHLAPPSARATNTIDT